jgi:hypothetical protein
MELNLIDQNSTASEVHCQSSWSESPKASHRDSRASRITEVVSHIVAARDLLLEEGLVLLNCRDAKRLQTVARCFDGLRRPLDLLEAGETF